MLAQLPQLPIDFDFDNLTRQPWFAPAAGLLVAFLVILIAYFVLFRKRAPAQPASSRAGSKLKLIQRDPFIHGSTSEHRQSVRRRGKDVKVLLANAEGTEEQGSGWVIDRSMGGLCVIAKDGRKVGTIFCVRPAKAPEGVPWVQLEVRSCRADEDQWEMGCRFVRTPSWSVMLLFG